MREHGASLQAIGDEFGVSREWIRQLVGSPLRTKQCEHCGENFETTRPKRFCSRACAVGSLNERSRGECACGKAISPTATRCLECDFKARDADTTERRTRIVEMWAAGLSMAAIAEEIGTTANALGGELVRMRRNGWDLPLRRAATRSVPTTKDQARDQLVQAVRNGVIRRPARCESCGAERHVDGHHTDYSRPLFVEWLCRSCHIAHHASERRAA